MNIFIHVDQFALGGAGRVASTLLQGLVDRGHNVILETDISLPFLYPVPPQVTVVPTCREHTAASPVGRMARFVRRIRTHRRYLRRFRPQAVIAFLPTQFTDMLLASAGLGIPLIVSDHTAMSRNLGTWVNFVRRRLYSLASAATILTLKDSRFLGRRVPCKQVVYNPLSFNPLEQPNASQRRLNVLCVGRVSAWHVKGFDRIIALWGQLSREFPEWTLQIAGPGDDNSFSHLKRLAAEAGCENSVDFLGNVADIQPLYASSSVFALPSRVEGFPMALIEAMSQGCACVSFSMDGAIPEIAPHGSSVLIAPDGHTTAFASHLRSVLTSESLRQTLSARAVEQSRAYSIEAFMARWEEILAKATQNPH